MVVLSLACSCDFSVLVSRLSGRHALFPPKGEEEKSKGEQGRHDLGG